MLKTILNLSFILKVFHKEKFRFVLIKSFHKLPTENAHYIHKKMCITKKPIIVD